MFEALSLDDKQQDKNEFAEHSLPNPRTRLNNTVVLDLIKRVVLDRQLPSYVDEELLIAAERYLFEDDFLNLLSRNRIPVEEVITGFGDTFRELWKAGVLDFDSPLLRETPKHLFPLLLGNLRAMQLTLGCNVGCSFCGVGAPAGVTDSFTYRDIHSLLVLGGEYFRSTLPPFYWASDPLDWEGHERWHDLSLTYREASELAGLYAGYFPYLSTAVPNGKEDRARSLLDLIGRISLSYTNQQRLRERMPELFTNESDLYVAQIPVNPYLNVRTRDNEKLKTYLSEKGAGFEKEDAIGCLDGVLLTPKGYFNLVQFRSPSLNYPEAQITQRIDLAKLERSLPDSEVELSELLSGGIVKERWSVPIRGIPSSLFLNNRIVAQVITPKESKAFVLDPITDRAFPATPEEVKYSDPRFLRILEIPNPFDSFFCGRSGARWGYSRSKDFVTALSTFLTSEIPEHENRVITLSVVRKIQEQFRNELLDDTNPLLTFLRSELGIRLLFEPGSSGTLKNLSEYGRSLEDVIAALLRDPYFGSDESSEWEIFRQINSNIREYFGKERVRGDGTPIGKIRFRPHFDESRWESLRSRMVRFFREF
jgi:hypothetical protein